MSMDEVMKLKKKGENAMSKSLFSKVKPEKALGYFEEAYKVLRKLPSTTETCKVQIELLEKLADCEHILEMDFSAAKRLEEAARLLQHQQEEGPDEIVPMLMRSSELYNSAGNCFKACTVILHACKFLEEKRDKVNVHNLAETLAVTCEEESFPQFTDILEKTISLLIRMECFEKAREIIKRERDLLKVDRLKWRNLLSEVVLFLHMKLPDKAKQLLQSDKTEDFQSSNEYDFGSKLVNAFECLDKERLEALKGPGSNWSMLLSPVARIGRKLTLEGFERVVIESASKGVSESKGVSGIDFT